MAGVYPHITATALRLSGLQLNTSRVIDLGGGQGTWIRQMLEQGLHLGSVLDQNHEKIATAATMLREIFPPERFKAMVADVTQIPADNCSYDMAVSRSSLHFWHDLPAALHEVARILVPGGFFFSGRGYGPDTPDEVRERAKTLKKQMFSGEGISGDEPAAISAAELSKILDDCGFDVLHILNDHSAFWIFARKR